MNMKRNIILNTLLFISFQLLSQSNIVEKKSFSLLNSDSIYIKIDVNTIDSDLQLTLEIDNNSNSNIYLDTSYLKPYIWQDSIKGPVVGVGFSHLIKEDVSEYMLDVFRIKPQIKILKTFLIEEKVFEKKLNNVKKYSFEIKYLKQEMIEKKFANNDIFKISGITYYFNSKRYIIGNCDRNRLLTE